MGIKNGLTRPGPFASKVSYSAMSVVIPPMAVPMTTAKSATVRRVDLVVGLLQGFFGGDDSELGGAIGAASFFAIHVGRGIEVRDFAGYLRIEGGGIEERNPANAGLSGDKLLPVFGGVMSECADHADPGNDDAADRGGRTAHC